MEDIIKIIQENSLTVRCLPFEVVEKTIYNEGDEHKKYIDPDGKEIVYKSIEVITEQLDIEYFEKNPVKFDNRTALQRLENWRKVFPNGRKILIKTKSVDYGGYWYVKETKNTNSNVEFNIKYDKFFAPTLEQAIKMYLDSKV